MKIDCPMYDYTLWVGVELSVNQKICYYLAFKMYIKHFNIWLFFKKFYKKKESQSKNIKQFQIICAATKYYIEE